MTLYLRPLRYSYHPSPLLAKHVWLGFLLQLQQTLQFSSFLPLETALHVLGADRIHLNIPLIILTCLKSN